MSVFLLPRPPPPPRVPLRPPPPLPAGKGGAKRGRWGRRGRTAAVREHSTLPLLSFLIVGVGSFL